MGKGSSGGEQIQRVIRELPEEANHFFMALEISL